MPLTDTAHRRAKAEQKPYKLYDSAGLPADNAERRQMVAV
jgi:hypothetical protein